MDLFLIASIFFVFLVIYNIILYPLLISFVSQNKPELEKKDIRNYPSISILISAYNEEKFIEDAILSIINSDYPIEKINIITGSDGSEDKTYEIMNELAEKHSCLKAFNFPRSGKNRIINELGKHIRGDFVFYMDADIKLKLNTIKEALSYFTKDTGAVICGMDSVNIFEDQDIGNMGESAYQRYEEKIRISESRIFSTVSALGAFYGVRTEHYNPLPNDNVLDDYVPLLYVAKKKLRIKYLSNIRVIEQRTKSTSNEIDRRKRITASGFATLWQFKSLLFNNFGWYTFALWSHRIIRWMMPEFLLFLLLTSFLIENDFSRNLLLYLQLILYFSGLIGWITEKINIKIKYFRFAYLFLSINYGFFTGFLKFLFNKNLSVWGRKIN